MTISFADLERKDTYYFMVQWGRPGTTPRARRVIAGTCREQA